MRLASTQLTSEDLQSDIKARFAEFNALSSRSTGRRYPQELIELVQQALDQGTSPKILRRLTGVSATAMKRWIPTQPVTKARSAKLHKARKLEIMTPKSVSAPAVLVRLPSGVIVEFSDAATVSGGLLNSLAALGVAHVTAR